jgi:hypothetical protein
MNKLVYIFVSSEFVIGQVVLKLLIKRLVVAMVNKTEVVMLRARQKCIRPPYGMAWSARPSVRLSVRPLNVDH